MTSKLALVFSPANFLEAQLKQQNSCSLPLKNFNLFNGGQRNDFYEDLKIHFYSGKIRKLRSNTVKVNACRQEKCIPPCLQLHIQAKMPSDTTLGMNLLKALGVEFLKNSWETNITTNFSQ